MPPSCAASDAIRQVVSLHRLRVGLCLFDKLCRYIAYGWGSVETQQIPAILEVGHPIEVATESAITLKAASQMLCPVSGVGRMVWS